jgi:hypothetical protein
MLKRRLLGESADWKHVRGPARRRMARVHRPKHAGCRWGGAIMFQASSKIRERTCTETPATRTASYPALTSGCVVRGGQHIAAEQHAGDHPAVRLALFGRRDPVA